jgi:hypothetical protein
MPSDARREPCPTDELLAAYLTSSLADVERRTVDFHVRSCDQCVQALTTAQRRLSLADEVAVPVPAAVRTRVEPVVRPPRLHPTARGWFESAREHVTAWLRWPVLVPVAVAVIVLLVVVRSDWRSPVSHDGARAVHTSNVLRVAAAQAEVHVRPAMQQPVVATLQRGAQVTVAEESGDWYLVVLPDGKQGWIDRRAFE